MSNKEIYSYPDKHDVSCPEWQRKNEPYRGYWEKSTNKIVKKCLGMVKNGEDIRIIDAGCGEGGLFPLISQYSKDIIAIEPDSQRIEKAKSVAQHLPGKFTFINTKIEEAEPEEKADGVICSHIIQHVSLDVISKICDRFVCWLKTDGTLIILTAHSTEQKTYFVKFGTKEETAGIKEEIGREEYQRLIKEGVEDYLPIIMFTLEDIKKYFEKYNLKLLSKGTYHEVKKIPFLDWLVDRDDFFNKWKWFQKRTGRELFLVYRKS